jgi:hypothetical protein
MWKGKFVKNRDCPVFRLNERVNPVTKRKIEEGGPAQRWLKRACKRSDVSGNMSAFVREQGPIGLERLITRIQAHEGGMFIRDLKTLFISSYRGAERSELPYFILDLGARKFKISLTGPMAKRLRELVVDEPFDVEEIVPDEPEAGDFCKTKNIKALPRRPNFQPQPHQIRAVDLMEPEESRILLEHGLGSGKTCTSAMVVDRYLETHPQNMVYFFSPGGLRSNFMNEYCSFCPVDRRRGVTNKNFKNFRFFSLDDSGLKRKLPNEFKDCMVVIDEAQSLINSVRYVESNPVTDDVDEDDEDGDGGGKNLSHLFELLTHRYNNIKLLMLSGTPMPDTLDQHYNCLRLLNPEVMEEISRGEFEDMFEMQEGVYIPKDNRLKPLYEGVFYYKSEPGDVARSMTILETIPVGEDNEALSEIILEAMDTENRNSRMPLEALVKTLVRGGMPRKKAFKRALFLKTRAARRDQSCRLSNMLRTEDGYDPSEDLDEDNIDNILRNYSPKLERLVQNLENEESCPGKQIIYCPFKRKQGVQLIGKILSIRGISNVIYSGDLSNTQRERVLLSYNSPENDDGQNIRVFIFTDAAAEGISLQSVRGVHLINESIYSSRMKQVIGRAIRYRSHERLPEEERTVTIFRYRLQVGPEGESADHSNYVRGMSREFALSHLQNLIHGGWV